MASEPIAMPERIRLALEEIRERVAARHPQGVRHGVELADLMPLLHARDATEAKAASIGTVNPRPPGVLNDAVQGVKGAVARTLRWFVRDQVEFNRGVMDCVQATLEALNGCNRAIADVAESVARQRAEGESVQDLRSRWIEWHRDWERRLSELEVSVLRNTAELQASYQHRLTVIEQGFREELRQHAERTRQSDARWADVGKALHESSKEAGEALHRSYQADLERASHEIQQRLWGDLARVRGEYERLIHEELRIVRQRASLAGPVSPPTPPVPTPADLPAPPGFDYGRFAERFRGSEQHVRMAQQVHLPRFAGLRRVLDIGCGRGEFLEEMRNAAVPAEGIDLDAEAVALCRSKGLTAHEADLFPFLASQPEAAFDGIFCAQVVEHLPPARLPEMVRLCASRLTRGGVLLIETPNPESLAVFSTHFYLDPTHVRPVPPGLLVFCCEEAGLGQIEVVRLSPAVETMPSLGELPAGVRSEFFGALDYAVAARRL